MQRNEYIYILNGIIAGLKKNNISNVNPPLSDKQIDAISTAIMTLAFLFHHLAAVL